MKILVTGSAGFLGRRFVRTLTGLGHDVTGLDIAERRRSQRRDLRAPEAWPDRRYDLVVHCAAMVGGRTQLERAPLGCAANLAIDAALFDWARRGHAGRVLYISSSAVYPVHYQHVHPVHGSRPLDEYMVDLAGPEMPDELYGWAKLTGEILAARARLEGVKVTVVRPFSGYAGNQDVTYPFAAFARRAMWRADPFDVWGSGDQLRDFIHADDVVLGALAVAEEEYDGPVNLATGRPVSMRELALMFCKAAGYSPTLRFRPDQPAGVASRWADVTRMARFYKPRVTLEEGIGRIRFDQGVVSAANDRSVRREPTNA